jgi:hypothetical protein
MCSSDLNENHDKSASATKYPVEDGTTISDHVTFDPDQLSIEGIISVNSIYETVTSENPSNRPYEYYLKLVNLMDKGEPVTVVTGLKSYENMIIENLSINRTSENGRILEFSMSLTHIRKVKTQSTKISVAGRGKVISAATVGGSRRNKKQVAPKKDKGKVATKKPSVAKQASLESQAQKFLK